MLRAKRGNAQPCKARLYKEKEKLFERKDDGWKKEDRGGKEDSFGRSMGTVASFLMIIKQKAGSCALSSTGRRRLCPDRCYHGTEEGDKAWPLVEGQVEGH